MRRSASPRATTTSPATARAPAAPDGITNFHLAFACFRFAVIFEGIAKRAEIGTAAGADAAAVGRLSRRHARRGWALARA